MLQGPPRTHEYSAPSAGYRALFSVVLCGFLTVASAAQQSPPARMSLSTVMDRVIATDRNLGIADYEVRKTIVDQAKVRSRMAPRISLDAGAAWRGDETRSYAEVSTGSPPEIVRERRWTRSSSNAQSLGLNLSQPILDLTVKPARRQTELLEQISRWQLRLRIREVLFSVTAQYFEVLRQSQLVEENKKTLGQTTEQVRQAEGRLKAQEVIESDVLQARVSDEQARRAVMEAEVSRDLAMSRLAVTLDYSPVARFSLAGTGPGRLPAAGVSAAIQVAHQRREEVRIAQLALNRTQAERDGIMARFAPRMDFQMGADSATGSSLDRRDSWNAGLSFSWDIFDRGERKLDLKTNTLQLSQDGLRIEESLRVISNDVVDAWFTVDRYRKRLASLAVERKAAEANYDVQQGKYKAGLATALEVQTALRDLARVRIEFVSSTYTLEVAYRDLENVTALYESSRIDAAMERFAAIVPPGFPFKSK